MEGERARGGKRRGVSGAVEWRGGVGRDGFWERARGRGAIWRQDEGDGVCSFLLLSLWKETKDAEGLDLWQQDFLRVCLVARFSWLALTAWNLPLASSSAAPPSLHLCWRHLLASLHLASACEWISLSFCVCVWFSLIRVGCGLCTLYPFYFTFSPCCSLSVFVF